LIDTFWTRGVETSTPFSPSARRWGTLSSLTKVSGPTGTVISATEKARPLSVTVVPPAAVLAATLGAWLTAGWLAAAWLAGGSLVELVALHAASTTTRTANAAAVVRGR
jgi:hypothetical protein